MENNAQLVAREPFENISMGIFQFENESTKWLTRRQIGEALEYNDPTKAIQIIHKQHKNRLDKFSRVIQVQTVGGKQDAVLYNVKGVFEILRWSRQPRADAFMDWVWECLVGVIMPDSDSNPPFERGDGINPPLKTIVDTSKMNQTEGIPQTGVGGILQTEVGGSESIPPLIENGYQNKTHSKTIVSASENRRKDSYIPEPLMTAEQMIGEQQKMIQELSARLEALSNKVNNHDQQILKIQFKQDTAQLPERTTHESKARSPWREEVYRIAKRVAKQQDTTIKALFSGLYKRMTAEYSWVFSVERKAYFDKYGEIPNTSTLDIVEDSKMYSSIFMAMLKDMDESVLANKSKGEPVINVEPVIETKVEIKSAPEKSVNAKIDYLAESKVLVETLAKEMQISDHKKYGVGSVYRKIYKAIGKEEMKKIQNSWTHNHKKPAARIEMFNNKRKYEILSNAVNEVRNQYVKNV